MKHNAVFERLAAQCLPLIEAYHDDLLKHDAASLGGPEIPAEPFLHWTRSCGTHLLWLRPPETYPPAGVYLPYLFGQAEREHILKGCVDQAKYWAKGDPPIHAVHYFDGKALHKLTGPIVAVTIAEGYRRSVEAAWRAKDFLSTWKVPEGKKLTGHDYSNRFLVDATEGGAP